MMDLYHKYSRRPHLILQYTRTNSETRDGINTVIGHVEAFEHFVLLQRVAQRHSY